MSLPIPVLTLAGTKDGLLRITRAGEAYYNTQLNSVASQKGQFEVLALRGVSHAS